MKVIKIGAVWCSGCLIMKPRWEELEKKHSWLKTKYLDYDQDEAQVKKLKIKSDRLPVFVFFDQKGQEFLRLSGEISQDKLEKIVLENKNK